MENGVMCCFWKEEVLLLVLTKPNVRVTFDFAPGKILKETIRSIGFGVNLGNSFKSVNCGDLPNFGNSSSRLRDLQFFPVSIRLTPQNKLIERVGLED